MLGASPDNGWLAPVVIKGEQSDGCMLPGCVQDLQYAAAIGGRYGETWRGGIADLHQCIPRTPSAFSSVWYRDRLGAFCGLRCLGRGLRQTRDRSGLECASGLCEDKTSSPGPLSGGGDAGR